MTSELLPSNATPWEKAVADAAVPPGVVSSAITAIRGAKLAHPVPAMLPYIVWELGLGELSPYVPNLYSLIDQGVEWQRVRGTPMAIEKGIGWLGYSADLEEAPPRRAFWNSFQLHFSALPANDDPLLERLAGVTILSVPLRSRFRRGVYQYDAPALELDRGRHDNSMLEFESGVAFGTVPGIWSFGRTWELSPVLTEAEGTALGIWIAPPEGGALAWADLTFPWADATFGWGADGTSARAQVLASESAVLPAHVAFIGSADQVIGYRRARAVRQVALNASGPYSYGGARYAPLASGTKFYAEAMTAFGDGEGDVAKLALALNGTLAAGVPPGKLWLEPAELISPVLVGETTQAIALRPTVREQVKFLLRF